MKRIGYLLMMASVSFLVTQLVLSVELGMPMPPWWAAIITGFAFAIGFGMTGIE